MQNFYVKPYASHGSTLSLPIWQNVDELQQPTLHPPTIFPPGAYKSVPNKKNATLCTITDIADIVTDYIGLKLELSMC
jgi:hypothetical protein